MILETMEQMRKSEDVLLGILNKIITKKEGEFTRLELGDICQLQNLERKTKLSQYIIEGILTELDISYDERTGAFYQINFGKFKESIETMLKVTRLQYDSPRLKRISEEEKNMEYLRRLEKRTEEKRNYWREKGEYQIALQVIQRAHSELKLDGEKYRRKEIANVEIERQYDKKMRKTVAPLLIKEEDKYPQAGFIMKKYPKVSRLI